MGSSSSSGAAYWLLKRAKPEEVQAAFAGVMFLFSAAAIGGLGYWFYEYAVPNSAANSKITRREVAIEKCFSGEASTLNSNFSDRWNRLGADLLTHSPKVDIEVNKILVAWIDRRMPITADIDGTSRDGERIFIKQITIDSRNGMFRTVSHAHTDTFHFRETYKEVSQDDGLIPTRDLSPSDGKGLERARECAERYALN